MVTKVFDDLDEAEAEVDRLNQLSTTNDTEAYYFWRLGRVPIH